jgi:hypothetical protein
MDDINISLESDFRIILNSHIQMVGDAVLQSICISNHFAKYKILGFDKPQFFICDFRKGSLREIRKLEAAKNSSRSIVYEDFLEQFTKPALLCIRQLDNKNIMMELRDVKRDNPKYLLFISNGIKIPIPNCNFVARKSALVEKNKKALLFLINIP